MRRTSATTEAESPKPKTLIFVADARKELKAMPAEVMDAFGNDLWNIQCGDTPINASPFEGNRAGNLMKLTERHDGNTYRCVYAAKFRKAVFVLHVLQKKSKSGIATPQSEIERVHTRYAAATKLYNELFPLEEA